MIRFSYRERRWRKANRLPLYAYDCGKCRFNWCCGPLCACLPNLPATPPERVKEVMRLQAEWRKSRGIEDEDVIKA
jgi:hypothetical protein